MSHLLYSIQSQIILIIFSCGVVKKIFFFFFCFFETLKELFKCTFDIERIEPNKNNLLSSVFGLEPGRQININYETYEGQVIEPYSNTFTVGEINKGKPLASIKDDNKPIKLIAAINRIVNE